MQVLIVVALGVLLVAAWLWAVDTRDGVDGQTAWGRREHHDTAWW